MLEVKHLTQLIMELSACIDAGGQVDVVETVQHVKSATLFAWLAAKYRPENANFLCAFVDQNEEPAVWSDAAPEILAALAFGMEPEYQRIRMKFGITNNGLCLLISWLSEILARRWGGSAPQVGEEIG